MTVNIAGVTKQLASKLFCYPFSIDDANNVDDGKTVDSIKEARRQYDLAVSLWEKCGMTEIQYCMDYKKVNSSAVESVAIDVVDNSVLSSAVESLELGHRKKKV